MNMQTPSPQSNSPFGDWLEVNLSAQTYARKPVSATRIECFLGGRGLNVGYLYQHLMPGTDALEADNILLVSCGLLTGSRAPAASRLHLNALSPLTGLIGSSNVGGYAGAWLRSTGLMGIAIRGRAARPVYLYISEDEVAIRDAGPYWGLDTWETQQHLWQDLAQPATTNRAEGPNAKKLFQILAIGPAGETGSLLACIVTGKDHAAGRTGLGAVMGAKHLKAIVIRRGGLTPFDHRRTASAAACTRYLQQIQASPEYRTFSRYGGAGYLEWADSLGIMGTRNYRQNRFEQVSRLDGRHLWGSKVRSSGCHRCPVQCKAELEFPTGPKHRRHASRPEFEPMINLGARCGLADPQAVVYLDNLCTRLGLDSTSTAGTIAFAMDLFERGILSPADCEGQALTWGDAAAMEGLIWQMAAGQGLGQLLGQGVKRAAAAIGRGAEQYAPHVKGLELTAYHPSTILGSALGYAVSSRGGDYNNVYASLEHRWTPEQSASAFGTPEAVDLTRAAGKGRLIRRAVVVNIVMDSLGLCKVPALSLLGTFDLLHEAELASAVTGRALKAATLFQAGERIAALERLFNLRHNPDLEPDTLPKMFFKFVGGALTPALLEQMRQEYYESMGYDQRGVPRSTTLAALDLPPAGPSTPVVPPI